MRDMVRDLDGGQAHVSVDQLQNLVEDMQNLQQSLAALNPINYLRFQVSNLAGEDISKPAEGHWAHVLVCSPVSPSCHPLYLAYSNQLAGGE